MNKNQTSIKNNFKNLFDLMSIKERLNCYYFIFLILVQVMLETLSIGALYPLLLKIFSPDSLNNYNFFFDFINFNFSINNNNFFIINISIIIFLLFLIKNFFLIYVVHWTQKFERNFKLRLKKKLLHVYLLKDYLFLITKDTSKLVRNINTSTDTIMMSLRVSMAILTDGFLLVGLIILMSLINFTFILVSMSVIIILSIVYFNLFKKILIKYGHFTFEFQGQSLKRLLQTFSMIKQIKIFNKENFFINNFYNEEVKFQEFQKKAFILRSYLKPFFELTFIFTVLFFINFQTINNDDIYLILPKLGIFILILLRLIPSISKILNSLQKQNQYQATILEVNNDLKFNIDINLSKKSNNLEIIKDFKNIELQNISFKYPSTTNYVIKNFSVTINKGDYIGIIGPSGSGKSSFVDILVGLLPVSSGFIKFNDKIVDTKSNSWNNLFSYVSQDNNVFNDSLVSNITLEVDENKIDKNLLKDCIQKSGLDKFMDKLNNKTNLGEVGSSISGGEKQRVCIARALYKKSEIIILDESLNALDFETKKEILLQIKKLSKYKTIISISHQIADLKDCNKIINL